MWASTELGIGIGNWESEPKVTVSEPRTRLPAGDDQLGRVTSSKLGASRMPTKGPKVLTLKQRLVALTQAPSVPSSPLDPSPKSPTTKRKFIPPWVKRTNPQNGDHDEFIGEDRLQLLISNLIYQAGVDYECVLPSQSRRFSLLTTPMTEHVRCNAIRLPNASIQL